MEFDRTPPVRRSRKTVGWGILENIEIILQCLHATTTKTGLTVTAQLVETVYEKGISISDEQMEALNLAWDSQIPKWNYSIMPKS